MVRGQRLKLAWPLPRIRNTSQPRIEAHRAMVGETKDRGRCDPLLSNKVWHELIKCGGGHCDGTHSKGGGRKNELTEVEVVRTRVRRIPV